ncbi:metabotropic glutamate receptor 3-like [Saccoglossus kowalevskii]|uniref:Metabotropic glutamate receptor 3-like n=1 Tax=Saccoglossus kowalevskii TaxID=10224 RepID=A0ABM0MLR8_SACKO|nr:PREDICTED: metabotropic glutamate receptor 3-like [Saccoglossus kowalevskii]
MHKQVYPHLRWCKRSITSLVYVLACQYLYITFVNGNESGSGYGPSNAYEDGDLIIGGLFPVHEKGENDIPCGPINANRGIQRLEAMLFAIDRINDDPTLLPGIKIGANILDTCSRDTYALEQSLEFIRSSLTNIELQTQLTCINGTESFTDLPKPVAGVIGGAYSSVSIQVANLLRLFHIPQVSYASTSAKLTDKTRYEFFARTVPPDNFQAKAIAEVVLRFNWTYVSTVASEGQYGEMGISQFLREARNRDICIATSNVIPTSSDSSTYDDVIHAIKRIPNARAVILFTRSDDTTGVLTAAKRANLSENFIWIASDGWGKQELPVINNEEVAEGAITLELQALRVDSFDEYFLKLNPWGNSRNPWFVEYWEQIFKCSIGIDSGFSNNTNPPCPDDKDLTSTDYYQDSKVQFVIDAVYAVAHALHNMHERLCPHTNKICAAMDPIKGEELYREILNVSFKDMVKSQVSFDEQGDGLGRYDIMNFQKDQHTGLYAYKKVGHWANVLYLDPSLVRFNPRLPKHGEGIFPYSQCSLPCMRGEVKHVREGESCCWICTKCQPWEYLKDEFTCVDCGNGSFPTNDLKGCYKLPKQHMEWHEVWSIIPTAIAIFGFIWTWIVIGIFLVHNDTPVVKASGRELSYLLLTGILMCYLLTFPLLCKPSAIVCGVQRFGLGLSFCICYAALLTKTNRISRIFNSAQRSAQRPKYISPQSQLVICFCIIAVQLIGEVIWFVLDPPGIRLFSPDGRRDIVILKCNIMETALIISLVYDMFLIMLCTVYAFKTRKIPENFNEAKFIGFTMYTTCIVWLSFVPIYFGTGSDFRIQTTTLSIAVSLSASVALGCLFVPKVYIIIFQPEKNVRKLSCTSATFRKPGSTYSQNHGHVFLHLHSSLAQCDSQNTDSQTSLT